jgi:hypothetical protein
MKYLKTFWELLKALPEILKLLKKLGDTIHELKYNSKIKEIEAAHNKLENAQTSEEKKDALKAITNTLKR